MASALTVLLLGCWLAGQSGASGEGPYPKPSISVSPSGVIPVGGKVTIRCRHQLLDMRILLYKDEDENYLTYTDPAGSEAEFPITSARREDGGNYTCRYTDRTGEVAYSEPSDPVQIVVAGETDLTQPGAAPAPTHPGSAEPAGPSGRPDFTHTNIARLGLGAMVLLVLGLILAEAYYSRPRGAPLGAWIWSCGQ
ncbi:T-cell-interacting, activating receptor on myeloid cells protein 1-like [Mauremys mutica]|uniref:T-cell-interacting, activating receptor on myeloid cells protein 1-like n=1 Tax=Mauremys mutica TaxID=74926 RepID=UPI001D160508|nr:T-cell-interacting, activating receptor on myeloid cells protein 1-like [Mauremys mutica]